MRRRKKIKNQLGEATPTTWRFLEHFDSVDNLQDALGNFIVNIGSTEAFTAETLYFEGYANLQTRFNNFLTGEGIRWYDIAPHNQFLLSEDWTLDFRVYGQDIPKTTSKSPVGFAFNLGKEINSGQGAVAISVVWDTNLDTNPELLPNKFVFTIGLMQANTQEEEEPDTVELSIPIEFVLVEDEIPDDLFSHLCIMKRENIYRIYQDGRLIGSIEFDIKNVLFDALLILKLESEPGLLFLDELAIRTGNAFDLSGFTPPGKAYAPIKEFNVLMHGDELPLKDENPENLINDFNNIISMDISSAGPEFGRMFGAGGSAGLGLINRGTHLLHTYADMMFDFWIDVTPYKGDSYDTAALVFGQISQAATIEDGTRFNLAIMVDKGRDGNICIMLYMGGLEWENATEIYSLPAAEWSLANHIVYKSHLVADEQNGIVLEQGVALNGKYIYHISETIPWDMEVSLAIQQIMSDASFYINGLLFYVGSRCKFDEVALRNYSEEEFPWEGFTVPQVPYKYDPVVVPDEVWQLFHFDGKTTPELPYKYQMDDEQNLDFINNPLGEEWGKMGGLHSSGLITVVEQENPLYGQGFSFDFWINIDRLVTEDVADVVSLLLLDNFSLDNPSVEINSGIGFGYAIESDNDPYFSMHIWDKESNSLLEAMHIPYSLDKGMHHIAFVWNAPAIDKECYFSLYVNGNRIFHTTEDSIESQEISMITSMYFNKPFLWTLIEAARIHIDELRIVSGEDQYKGVETFMLPVEPYIV